LLRNYQDELPEPFDELYQNAYDNNNDFTKVLVDFVKSLEEDSVVEYIFEIVAQFKNQNYLENFIDLSFSSMFEYIDLSRIKRVLDYSRKRYELDKPTNEIKPQFRKKLNDLKFQQKKQT